MFISVDNFINSGCHVKGNCRPEAVRLAGELGYPDAARCILFCLFAYMFVDGKDINLELIRQGLNRQKASLGI
jgi:hypothetical protein